MKRRGLLKSTVSLIGFLCELFPCYVPAENLDEAWSTALSADSELKAVRQQTGSAQQTLEASKGERLPNVIVEGVVTQLDKAPAVGLNLPGLPLTGFTLSKDQTFGAAQALVTLPIYTHGRISAGIDAASAGLEAAHSQEILSGQDLKLAVAQAYIMVLRAQRQLSVAEKSVESLSAHARDAGRLFDKGLAPKNHLLASQVAAAEAKQKAIQATNALDIARAAYNRRLGRALTDPVAVDEVIPANSDSGVLASQTSRAAEQRPELAALAGQAEALRHKAEAIRAATGPQVGLAGGYTYLSNSILKQHDFWSVTLGVQWKLFDGGVSRHQAEALLKQAQAAAERRTDLQSMVALQVRQAWLEIQEAQQRIGVMQLAVEQAEENLEVAISRYRSDLGNNTEVLDAETLRSASYMNRDTAVYDAVMAHFRLRRAVGEL